jgi:hypothetical protein
MLYQLLAGERLMIKYHTGLYAIPGVSYKLVVVIICAYTLIHTCSTHLL